ncbi:MAG: DUF1648 domain-containing protein [Thermoanaerobacteraceae bacterium]|nr:DUF1648 domain-containing protein [Thermoanaerobacteraceae bacterium]
MKTKKNNWILLGLVAICFILTIVLYPNLPDKIPTHWNFQGEIDSYSSKLQGGFMIPIMLLVFYPMFIYLPHIDPHKENYKKFEGAYETIIVAIFAFMTSLHVIILLAAMGYNVNITVFMSIGLSLLFIILGNVLTKIKPNFFVGIKNPWTISDDEVWRKTHRLGGWLFVIVGVLGFPIILVDSRFAALFEVAGILLVSLITAIYSYILYKNKIAR